MRLRCSRGRRTRPHAPSPGGRPPQYPRPTQGRARVRCGGTPARCCTWRRRRRRGLAARASCASLAGGRTRRRVTKRRRSWRARCASSGWSRTTLSVTGGHAEATWCGCCCAQAQASSRLRCGGMRREGATRWSCARLSRDPSTCWSVSTAGTSLAATRRRGYKCYPRRRRMPAYYRDRCTGGRLATGLLHPFWSSVTPHGLS
mmetsp:Transcript_12499/g.40289  ORF Transcript_12499/g.40289 Transcript_12499/m.40289 type:complete len:203 (+) Transcript_12499:125-733(+)